MMSITKGTPASSQIIWLEERVKQLEAELAAVSKRLENTLNEGAKRREERNVALDLLKQARDVLEPVSFNRYDADIREEANNMIIKINELLGDRY